MPRTDITAQEPVNVYKSISANAADFTWTAADVTNKNSATLTGRELLLVKNDDGVNAQTVTITSVADAQTMHRSGDITAYSIGANEFAMFGPFPLAGWRQSDGKLYFEASNANVKFAVIRIPNNIAI